jgi:hypothetical protein
MEGEGAAAILSSIHSAVAALRTMHPAVRATSTPCVVLEAVVVPEEAASSPAAAVVEKYPGRSPGPYFRQAFSSLAFQVHLKRAIAHLAPSACLTA